MSGRRTLPALIVATLAAYVVAHSPIVGLSGRLVGHRAGTCYFVCTDWAPHGRVLEMAAAVASLLMAGWAAGLLADRLVADPLERHLTWGILALALLVVPASWAGFAGWKLGVPWLRPPIGPLLVALPSVLLVAWARRRRWQRLGRPAVWSPLPRLVTIIGAIAATLLALSVAVSLLHPPTGYDALSYHAPLAVYYWRDGELGGYLARQPWASALAHPGTAELWFGLLRIAAGERLANLGQLPFALLGAAAVTLLARRTGLARGPAALAGAAFLAAPIVVVQSGMQLNDLAAGSLVLAAVAMAAAPSVSWSPVTLALLGLTAGLAVTTKLAVLPAIFGVWVYVVVRLPTARGPVRLLIAGAGPFLVAGGAWWLRNIMMFGNPIFPAALPLVGRGAVMGAFVRKDEWFVPGTWAWPLYPVIEPHDEMSGFGALFAVAALPGLAAAVAWGRRGPMALLGIVALTSGLAWWKLTQHEPRLLLGVIGAGFVGVGWTLVALPRPQRARMGGVLIAAAGFSAAVTLDRAVLPQAALPTARAHFYEAEWGIDSTVAALPPRDGLMYHTGHAYRSYAGDYPLLGPDQRRSIVVIDGTLPTDSIAGLMRSRGLRYAYVPATAGRADTVLAMYRRDRFELVRTSTRAGGRWRDTRRFLFRLRDGTGP